MGDLDGYVRSLEKLITDSTRLQEFRLASRQKAHSFEIEVEQAMDDQVFEDECNGGFRG